MSWKTTGEFTARIYDEIKTRLSLTWLWERSGQYYIIGRILFYIIDEKIMINK